MKFKIGLAFSGGGFRAAAFHLGTLRKLKDMDLLDKIDVISSVSGGSITAASYVINKENFALFEKEFRSGLKQNMLSSSIVYLIFIGFLLLSLPFILAYFRWYLLILYIPIVILFLRFQFNLLPVSRWVVNRYDKIFFRNKSLIDLPDKPLLAINSTNIETGRLFTFSKEKMSDSSYEYPGNNVKPIKFLHSDFPLSRSVMASTCVPFAFSPIKINKRFFANDSDYNLINPSLIDGGVYDNQGIHKLTQSGSIYECDIIIASDAGTGFKPITIMNNTLMLLMQTSSLFMNRIKNVQYFKDIVLNKYYGQKSIAYFSLEYEPEDCISYFADLAKKEILLESSFSYLGLTTEFIRNASKQELISFIKDRVGYNNLEKKFPDDKKRIIARSVKTNLTPLNDKKIEALISISEVLTELQIKLYCPQLLDMVSSKMS